MVLVTAGNIGTWLVVLQVYRLIYLLHPVTSGCWYRMLAAGNAGTWLLAAAGIAVYGPVLEIAKLRAKWGRVEPLSIPLGHILHYAQSARVDAILVIPQASWQCSM